MALLVSNNTTLNPEVWEDILKQEEKESLLRIPAFVMLSLFMVLGVPGNILVIVVYRQKMKHSAYRVFVLSMAAFDLVNCLMGIPFEMVDLGNNITFCNAWACKIFRFMITFCACGSISILIAVTWERFRRVCCPLGSQITVSQSWILSAVNSFIAFLFALPALIFYGVKTEMREGYKLYDCSLDDSWRTNSRLVIAYQITLGMVWIICIFVLAGVYTFIIYTLKKQNDKRSMLSDTCASRGQPLVNLTLTSTESRTAGQVGPHGQTNFSHSALRNESGSCPASQDHLLLHQSTGEATHNVTNRSSEAVGVQVEKTFTVEMSSNAISRTTEVKAIGGADVSNVVNLTGFVNLTGDEAGSCPGDDVARKEAGDTAAFVRLFSRDVNPVGHHQIPTQHKLGGFDPHLTVLDDEDQIQPIDVDQDVSVQSLSPVQSPIGRTAQMFARQESLNNYYSFTAQTPEGSQDGLSQCDIDDGEPESSCKENTDVFRSWEAFNSSEGGGSFQTLNKTGSSEGIKPLAGNLKKQSKTYESEMSSTTTKFYFGDVAKKEKNMLIPSANKSCTGIDSANVSRRSSMSRAAQWGSAHVLNSESLSLDDSKNYGSFTSYPETSINSGGSKNLRAEQILRSTLCECKIKAGSDLEREQRMQKLGHCGKSAPLCVSDDIVWGNGRINRCFECAVNASLPFLTEELRKEELGQFTMRRTVSVPSLQSLPKVMPCRKNDATRNLEGAQHRSGAIEDQPCSADSTVTDTTQNNWADSVMVTNKQKSSQPQNRSSLDSNKRSQKVIASIANQDLPLVNTLKKTRLSTDSATVRPSIVRLRSISTSTARNKITAKLTFTMVAVTVGFIVSFLPHLIIQIARGLDPDGVRSLYRSSPFLFVLYHVLVRSYFTNNAINPIIYGFFNDTFRSKSVNLLKSWIGPHFEDDQCGAKICPTRVRVWALRDLGLSSSHREETA